MNSYLVDDNNEHKNVKGVNKNVVHVVHNEHKDVLKCLRHSINRIESKDHRIGTYEINRFFWMD